MPGRDVAFDLDSVQLFGVAAAIDSACRNAGRSRRDARPRARPACCAADLPLGDDPMFDARSLCRSADAVAAAIPGALVSRKASVAAIHGEAGLPFRELSLGHTDARDDQFGLRASPAL